MSGFFLWLARTPLGGHHEWWPVTIMVHDHGVFLCWKRVIKWEVRVKPTTPAKGGGETP